jgi:hypothetical protein
MIADITKPTRKLLFARTYAGLNSDFSPSRSKTSSIGWEPPSCVAKLAGSATYRRHGGADFEKLRSVTPKIVDPYVPAGLLSYDSLRFSFS